MTKKGKQLKKEALNKTLQGSKKNNNKSSQKKQGGQAKTLVNLALRNAKLFYDQFNDEFARVKTDKGFPVYKIRSKHFKNWLGYQFYLSESENQVANSESLKSALNTLCGHAQFEGKRHDLHIRVADCKSAIWYDICDKNWQAIRITAQGWKIIKKPPILFRRYSHQLPQIKPAETGDINLLKKYINLKNEHEWILMQVWLIFALVPSFPHPVRILHGGQGSGKTNAEKLIRKLIDPSQIEVLGMPRSENELTQILAHHWFLPFDNINYLSDSISDLLCKAITGSGFSKRELYTDDDDIIYKIKRCISLNGINIAAHKPDLLERSILLEFKRISKHKRQTENEIWRQFEKDRPIIFSGILNTLSKALSIVKNINLKYKPRMADFNQWGEAIAQSLGYAPNIFTKAYFKNIKSQHAEAINAHLIGQTIAELMENQDNWTGSPTELFDELNNIAVNLKINTNDKAWPKAPNALSRRINEIKSNLAEIGITIKCSRKTQKREWIIKKHE